MFPGQRVKCSLCPGMAPVGELYENLMSNFRPSSHEANVTIYFFSFTPLLPPYLYLAGLEESLKSSLQESSPSLALVPVLNLPDSQILHLSCWLSL